MSKFLQVNISHDDKVMSCLIDPGSIELIRPQGKTCALMMKSGKVYGCNHSAESIANAINRNIVIVGAEFGEEQRPLEIKPIVKPKREVAVFTERTVEEDKKIEDNAANRTRMIDQNQSAAVVVEERKKATIKGIIKRPRGASASATPKGAVEAVSSFETTM